MTQTLQPYKIKNIQSLKEIANDEDVDCPKFLRARLRDALEVIEELQEKHDLLQLDFNAAQEIMGGMNKEIEELKKQNKSWKEMVDSTNQTNQALCKRLETKIVENGNG